MMGVERQWGWRILICRFYGVCKQQGLYAYMWPTAELMVPERVVVTTHNMCQLHFELSESDIDI